MTRTEYRKARRLLRQNGRYALRWMTKDHAEIMGSVIAKTNDLLAERADCYRSMGWGIHLAKSIARHHAAIRFADATYTA